MSSHCYFLPFILLTVYITDISKSTDINCTPDQDCFISCNSTSGCVGNKKINCPSNQQCTVSCNDINSCKGTIINASSASKLDIIGCTAYQSCNEMTIYCPPNTNHQKKCLIEGNHNLDGINIYAVNGWSDIDIAYNNRSNDSNTNIKATMYCTKDTPYDTSCTIASDEWTCTDINNYCNNLQLSPSNITNHTPNTSIDAEMLIIIITLIAAICFIGACCWYTIKTNKSTKAHKRGSSKISNSKYIATYNNNQISSTNHIHQIFTNRAKTSDEIIPKPRSITSDTAQSTGNTVSVDIATDVEVISNNTSMEPEPLNNFPQNIHKEHFDHDRSIEHDNNDNNNMNNRLNVINENDTNMKDLNVESFAKTVEQNKRMNLSPNVSESESTNIKSPDTWDNFEKDNGILGDQCMMNAMMGYLEEGTICCSLE